MIWNTSAVHNDTDHTYKGKRYRTHNLYVWLYVLFSGMANKKTHLTIKASRTRKKDLRLERDFVKSLSRENQADIIEAFNSTSRYLDDLLNIENIYFDQMVDRIYLTELPIK